MPNYHNHVSLVYNLTGQEVSFVPPMSELVLEGAATVATAVAYAGTGTDDATAEFTATVTLDVVSTTVDVASGHSVTANRNKLSLAATTGIVIGHRYLVANTSSQRELVTVREIAAGDYVILEEPLSYDYPITSSTFKGIRHYFTIPAAFIQNSDKINIWGSLRTGAALFLHGADTSTAAPPYRIRWTYSIGSVSRITWSTFDVVRKALKHGVGINDLRELLPDVIYNEWISQRGQDFLPQLDAAFEIALFDIRMAGYDPDAITDPEILDLLVRQKWVVVIGYALAAQSGEVSQWLQAMDDKYQKMFQASIGTSLKTWIDTGSSGAITPRPATQLWLRGR